MSEWNCVLEVAWMWASSSLSVQYCFGQESLDGNFPGFYQESHICSVCLDDNDNDNDRVFIETGAMQNKVHRVKLSKKYPVIRPQSDLRLQTCIW